MDRTYFRRLVLTLEAVLSKAWDAGSELDAGGVASAWANCPSVTPSASHLL